MRKIFRTIITLALGAIGLVSCKTALTETPDYMAKDGEIYFGTRLEVTKAVTETTADKLQANGWGCAAVIDTDNSVMFNTAVTYDNGVYKVPDKTYYFPSAAGSTMSFYGVYPKTQAITVSEGAATLVYTQDNLTDLVAAKKTAVAKQSDAVAMSFDHILSQVDIQCKGKDAAADYYLKSLKITAPDGGTYKYADGTWTRGADTVTDYYANAGAAVPTNGYQPYGESMTFLPGAATIEASWLCKNIGTATIIGEYTVSCDVIFKQGYHSTFKLLLPNNNADPINFTVSVNSWTSESSEIEMKEPVPDLSKHDIYGNKTDTHNTANCYVVKGAGTYRLPLVYGNAIKDDAANTAAYTNIGGHEDMADFVNANNVPITSPYIKEDLGSVDGCKVVWMDQDNLVNNLALTESGAGDLPNGYLTFDVNGNKGNAVIAATSAGTVVWSWHIWVYNGDLEVVKYTDSNSEEFEFLNTVLGWVQTGETVKDGIAPYYQFGRKDPVAYNDNTAGYTFDSGSAANISIGIRNPGKFYKSSSSNSWFNSYNHLNLWNAQQKAYKSDNLTCFVSTANQKTVYDPCPVGFCVPQMANFKGMIGTYEWWYGSGIQFNADFWLPDAGYRNNLGKLYSEGSEGDFWSSDALSRGNAWQLCSESGEINADYFAHAGAFSVLPVPEF